MTVGKSPRSRLEVTPLEDFLRCPPAGFSVEKIGGSDLLVSSDPESSLVLIDDIDACSERVLFQNSLGSKVKMKNLWEYSSTRKSLLSKRIYLVASTCFEDCSTKTDCGARVRQQYVVSVDGSDPFIRYQMERGLDWTISSVAGESYRVDIDLAELLENCKISPQIKVAPAWTNASFTLKYFSDALFDFAHWFGFSKRLFKLKKTWADVS